MAGPVTLKLKEIKTTLELIRETITTDFDPITFKLKEPFHRYLTWAQIGVEICDLQLKWTTTKYRALQAQEKGIEPWTRKNRNKLDIIITAVGLLRNTMHKTKENPEWLLEATQETLSDMKTLKWDYMRDRTPKNKRITIPQINKN